MMVQHLLYEIYLLPFAACVDLSWLPFCFVDVITSFVVVITIFIEGWWYFYEIMIFWRK
jgi:hypothetical protein